jgi:uncharacterized membrane protein YesL
MRVFGKYFSTRYVRNSDNGSEEQQNLVVMVFMIFALTCFSVMSPTFFLFWIPLFIAYPTVKKFLNKKEKIEKEKDYE